MTVSDIIKKAATLINLKNVSEYLGGGVVNADEETLATVSKMTSLTNLVLNELSVSYVPMKTTERKIVTDGKVMFSSLTKTPYKILDVFDAYGEKVFYTLYPTYIKTKENEVDIVYAYVPTSYGLSDVVGYSETEVSSRLIAYAVLAEYMLTVSAFDEAIMWRKRFTSELEESVCPTSKNMRRRSFI